VAVGDASDHRLNFEEFNAGLPLPSVNSWTRAVELWEDDNSKPNPFEVQVVGEHVLFSTPFLY
jgi:hypothetical protein